jgi:hypothetical protein
MRQQRGTCDATLYGYSIPVRDLLKKLGEDPGTFDAQNLRQFILDTSQRCGWASAKKCTTAVRMLRFLIADGSAPPVWRDPSPFSRIGGFRPCRGICSPRTSNG